MGVKLVGDLTSHFSPILASALGFSESLYAVVNFDQQSGVILMGCKKALWGVKVGVYLVGDLTSHFSPV